MVYICVLSFITNRSTIPVTRFSLAQYIFLTPRKCGIFGICCEAIPRQASINEFVVTKLHTFIFQVTYLIDEAFNVGKGANSIISMLHHFFQTHGIGEKSVHLHADNCAGQNKNRFMMYYLMWRVRTGLHEEVTISFLPVGHTKFHPTGALA